MEKWLRTKQGTCPRFLLPFNSVPSWCFGFEFLSEVNRQKGRENENKEIIDLILNLLNLEISLTTFRVPFRNNGQ